MYISLNAEFAADQTLLRNLSEKLVIFEFWAIEGFRNQRVKYEKK